MVGRWLNSLLVLVAVLAPGGAALAQSLPELPPPPPPKTPPPPPPGLRPLLGPDGRMVTDAEGRPQFLIDLPAPPAAGRADNVPPVIMRHLTPAGPLPLTPGPGTLPLPAGQAPGGAAIERTVVPPVPASTGGQSPASALPQTPPSSAPVPPPPPSEGGRRPGLPRGL